MKQKKKSGLLINIVFQKVKIIIFNSNEIEKLKYFYSVERFRKKFYVVCGSL